MTPHPSDRLREIGERIEKATEGPWQTDSGDVYDTRGDGAPGVPLVRSDREYRRWGRELTDDERDANAAFIAHARDDIPWLLSEVERLTITANRADAMAVALDRQLKEAARLRAENERKEAALEIGRHLANATINGQPKSYRTTIAWDFHGALDKLAAALSDAGKMEG